MAKKYNKSREQKPNYSKRGKHTDSTRMEASREFDFAEKLREQKDNTCDNNFSSCSKDLKK